MKFITSSNNILFKQIKLLTNNIQARSKFNYTVLDGIHLAQIYLQPQLLLPVKYCVVAQSAIKHHEIVQILACTAIKNCCVCLSDILYRALSQVKHGIGLLLIIPIPKYHKPSILKNSTVLLNNLQDPGNLGSIFRSAVAAGIKQVFCSKNTTAAWSPKVLRAGMGAHFFLKIIENADLDLLCRISKITILTTSPHAKKTIYQINLKQNIAWVFGNEGQGIAKNLLNKAVTTVAVPHQKTIESLNVAATAAICFFEQIRQKKYITHSKNTHIL